MDISSQGTVSPKYINIQQHFSNESLHDEQIPVNSNKLIKEMNNHKQSETEYINTIPTKVFNAASSNLSKSKLEDFCINKNISNLLFTLDFQLLNDHDKPHSPYNTFNNVDKDFLNKTHTPNPNNYFYNPIHNIPIEYSMMSPYINYIRTPIAYPYYSNQSMIPPPQSNPYQNNINPLNMSMNNSQQNGNLELQNKNFQQKVSIIKLESENKALKEKIVEMTTSINNLQQNINNIQVQSAYIREPETNNREHENMIRDLKNKVK